MRWYKPDLSRDREREALLEQEGEEETNMSSFSRQTSSSDATLSTVTITPIEEEIKIVNPMEDNYAEIEYSAKRARAAAQATAAEHRMTVSYTFKRYPRLIFWLLVFNFIAVGVEYCNYVNIRTTVPKAYVKEYGYKPWFCLMLPLGELAGLFAGSMVSDKKGRKIGIYSGIIISSFAAIFEAASNSQNFLVVSMVMLGIGLGMLRVNALIYCSEISPVSLRGISTAGIAFSGIAGAMLGNIITYLFTRLSKDSVWSFRGPFLLQLLFFFVAGIFVRFAPETPWWLARAHSSDAAKVSLHKIYGKYEDVTNLTFAVEKTVARESEMRCGCPYIAALTVRRHIRRTFIIFGAFACSALSGYGFIQRLLLNPFPLRKHNDSNNNNNDNYKDSKELELFRDNSIVLLSTLFGGFLCLLLVSTLGRRRTFIAGSFLLPILLLMFAVVEPNISNTTWGKGIYTGSAPHSLARFVFGCVYLSVHAATIGGTAYVLVADVSAPIFRSATACMALMLHTVLTSGLEYAAPKMIEKMGSLPNACFIFVGLGVVGSVWSSFFVPELKRRTFEEVGELFDMGGLVVRRMRNYEV